MIKVKSQVNLFDIKSCNFKVIILINSMKMSETFQFCTIDVDGPLYNYFFISSPIGYENASSNKSFWQLIKSYFFICLYLIYILKGIFLLFCDTSNSNYLIYFGDVYQVFEKAKPYTSYTILLMYINTFLILLLFQFSSEHDLKWLSVIRILKGYENWKSLNYKNVKTLKKFLSRAELIIGKIVSKLAFIAVSITSISFLYLSFEFQRKHVSFYFTNPWRIFDVILIYSFIGGRYVVYSYYYLICYKIKLELIDLKSEIDSVLSVSSSTISLSNRTIDKLLHELGKIQISMNCYNRFWKKYLWFALFTSIPGHAFLLFCLINSSIKLSLLELICVINEFIECNLISLFIFYPLFTINTHFKSLYKSYYQLLMLASVWCHPKYEKVNFNIFELVL